jgi:hypothetical protein
LLTGYIYSLRYPGSEVPSYIGQTIDPVRRKQAHLSGKSRTTASEVVGFCRQYLGHDPDFVIEQEVYADQEWALQWLLNAGEKGFISEYEVFLSNIRPGGTDVIGENNPFYSQQHSKETKDKMRAAWTKERKEKYSARLKGKTPWAKLTDEQVLYIRECDKSNRVLAKEFGVNPATIIRIRKHKFYTHVGGPAYKSRRFKHGKYAKPLK